MASLVTSMLAFGRLGVDSEVMDTTTNVFFLGDTSYKVQVQSQ
jgi:hypothetical protein